MTKGNALNQLCKMQGEIAGRLGLETACVCHKEAHSSTLDCVPDEVIEEMWRRLTDQRWAKEEARSGKRDRRSGR